VVDVEDREQGEKELRKLLDVVPQYICVYTSNGRPLYANDSLLDYFGFTLEDFRADDFRTRAFHPDDLERVHSVREEAIRHGEGWEVEARILRKDGQYRWFLIRGKPLRDDEGRIVRWFSSGTDIHDRKQAETELQELVDAVPQHIVVLSGDGRRLYANQTARDYHGLTLEEFLAEDVPPKCFHPADVESYRRLREAGIASGKPWEAEARLLGKDGQYRWFLYRANPLPDAQGLVRRWYLTRTDIEDRKRAETELQELVDAVPQHIVVFAADGRRLYANRVVLDFFGWTLEDFLDERKVRQGFHPDDLASFLDTRQQGISRGTPFKIEARLLARNGQYRWFLFLYNPYRDGQGHIVRWYATGTDIEDRKQAEEALRRSESYLAEAQRLSHTGSWAHDVVRKEIIYWSPESYRTFGFDPNKDTISYREAHNRIHPDDLQRFDETLERGIREKTGSAIGFRLLLPDGSIKHVHCVSRPVISASGEVVELVGTNMDVTEQHQARAALEKAFEEIKQLKDQLYRENLVLKEEIDHTSMFEEIVGTSEVLRRVLVQVAKVAPTDSTVLITGETGTGKELVARAIHKRSQRASRAFVSVNCAAIPATLIGSELFGHEKGAFTGATQRRLGRFELADGGTLFLDEVGDLPAETQIALLRVLQEQQFERIGGTQSIAVDVRIIAATNRDLKAAVTAGAFRSDLFYRLSVFPIAVPPLRDRKDDIPLLVEYLIERYASNAGKKFRHIHKPALELFQAYDWPGNIRELQNVIERAVILCDGETFSVDESWLQAESPRSRVTGNGLARLGADQERELIESALAQSRGRIAGPAGAAAKLGVPRSTLETKIRRLGIVKHRFKSA
jgi:PAS domain S-box-containing protein